MEESKYMNPYLAGVLLGILLLATIFITGRGLGASGAIKSGTIAAVQTIASSHTQNTKFYQEYAAEHSGSPLMNWLVFEVVGVLIGAFLSGLFPIWIGFEQAETSVRNGTSINYKSKGRRGNYRRNTLGHRFATWTRLHKWVSSLGNGCNVHWWNNHYVSNLRRSLYVCVVLQKMWI